MYNSFYSPFTPTVSTVGYAAPMTTTTYSTGLPYGGMPYGGVCTGPCITPLGGSLIGSTPVMMNAPMGMTYGGMMGVAPVRTTEVIEETTTYVQPSGWLW